MADTMMLLCPSHALQLPGTADERAACFQGLQKPRGGLCSSDDGAGGKQASTLLELMTIRAYHSKSLRQCGLGTAIGFRTRNGQLTSTPAIIVFVARKVHTQWLHEMQILPSSVEVCTGSLTQSSLFIFSIPVSSCKIRSSSGLSYFSARSIPEVGGF